VLAANIIMVLGEANPANGMASFVRGFAAAVSLGLDDLFTPANANPSPAQRRLPRCCGWASVHW
jgi:hypothetical protein